MGQGKLIPLFVQEGPWVPKALLGSFPKGCVSHECVLGTQAVSDSPYEGARHSLTAHGCVESTRCEKSHLAYCALSANVSGVLTCTWDIWAVAVWLLERTRHISGRQQSWQVRCLRVLFFCSPLSTARGPVSVSRSLPSSVLHTLLINLVLSCQEDKLFASRGSDGDG